MVVTMSPELGLTRLGIQRTIVRANPQVTAYRRELAASLNNLATLVFARGEKNKAQKRDHQSGWKPTPRSLSDLGDRSEGKTV